MIVIPFVLFGVLVVAVIAFSIISHRKMNARVAAYAHERGLEYTQFDRTLGSTWTWGPFANFGGRGCRWVIAGTSQPQHGTALGTLRPFRSFQYSYEDSSGSGENSSTTTYEYHFVGVEVGFPTPSVHLSRVSKVVRTFPKLAGKRILMNSEEFNNAWIIRSNDAMAPYRLLDQSTQRELLKSSYRPYQISWHNGELFIWRSGPMKLENIAPMLQLAHNLADITPRTS